MKICAALLSFVIVFLPISPRDGPIKFSFADSATEPRKVKVIALVDKDLFMADDNASQEIISMINFVSEVFKKEFNIVFEVTRFEIWEFPTAKKDIDLHEALVDVAIIANSQLKADDEIFLGFSPKFLFLSICDSVGDKTVCVKEEKTGYAYVFGNAAVIGFDERSKYIALHEIGHLFGATHTEENSIMNKQINNSTEFDEKNKEIIRKNRELVFPRIYVP